MEWRERQPSDVERRSSPPYSRECIGSQPHADVPDYLAAATVASQDLDGHMLGIGTLEAMAGTGYAPLSPPMQSALEVSCTDRRNSGLDDFARADSTSSNQPRIST